MKNITMNYTIDKQLRSQPKSITLDIDNNSGIVYDSVAAVSTSGNNFQVQINKRPAYYYNFMIPVRYANSDFYGVHKDFEIVLNGYC